MASKVEKERQRNEFKNQMEDLEIAERNSRLAGDLAGESKRPAEAHIHQRAAAVMRNTWGLLFRISENL